MKVLHVAAEVFPLVKTGGLADVVGALPQALARAGADVRLLLPGLPAIADAVLHQKTLCRARPAVRRRRASRCGCGHDARQPRAGLRDRRAASCTGAAAARTRRPTAASGPTTCSASPCSAGWPRTWPPASSTRTGRRTSCTPTTGTPAWPAPTWPRTRATSAASVFTVHNLAFQGLFPQPDFAPARPAARASCSRTALEFHGQLSFMKAGLKYADRITTVSPTYAREIATHEFGCGLDGVIRGRGADVSRHPQRRRRRGLEPGHRQRPGRALLARRTWRGKPRCKAALQAELGLAARPDAPLFGVVSRLTAQKGLDLVLGGAAGAAAQRRAAGRAGQRRPGARKPAFRRPRRAHPGAGRRCASATTRRSRTG